MMTDDRPRNPTSLAHAQLLLDSYRRLLGRELIDRSGDVEEEAARLFEAPFVVLSHGTEADPVLNYGNRVALGLWDTDLDTLSKTPSRLTAEAVHRDERARLLERVTRDGYIDDYTGIRISTTGCRFFIERATVWNLSDEAGRPAGQAATFASWRFLKP